MPTSNRLIKRIACDVDGVLFDFHGFVISHLAARGIECSREKCFSHDIQDSFSSVPPEVVLEYVQNSAVYEALPEISEGFEMVKRFYEAGFIVDFLTSRPIELQKLTRNLIESVLCSMDIDPDPRSFTIAYGNTVRKSKNIVRYDYVAAIDDNIYMYLLLTKLGFSKENFFLVSQPWSDNYKMNSRYSNLDVVSETHSSIADRIISQWGLS